MVLRSAAARRMGAARSARLPCLRAAPPQLFPAAVAETAPMLSIMKQLADMAALNTTVTSRLQQIAFPVGAAAAGDCVRLRGMLRLNQPDSTLGAGCQPCEPAAWAPMDVPRLAAALKSSSPSALAGVPRQASAVPHAAACGTCCLPHTLWLAAVPAQLQRLPSLYSTHTAGPKHCLMRSMGYSNHDREAADAEVTADLGGSSSGHHSPSSPSGTARSRRSSGSHAQG